MNKVQDNQDKLTRKQRQFINNFTDPSKETFLVGSKSYRAASPTANPNTARTESSQLLRQPKIQSEIERRFEEQGFTDQVTAKILHDHATGKATKQTKRYAVERNLNGEEVKDAEGNPKLKLVEVVESVPSFKDQQNAINLKAKLTGHYRKADFAAQAEGEAWLREMITTQRDRGNLPPARDVTPQEEDS